MGNKINLYWYKMPNGRQNFGDELGPYIVGKLSGCEISYIPIVNKWYKVPFIYILNVINGRQNIGDIKSVIRSMFVKNVILSIGSILGAFNRGSVSIWGSGLISSESFIHDGDFLAVRGKYSQRKLKELGYKEPTVLGDPALLLPKLIRPSSKKYKLGIIPHYLHYNEVLKSVEERDDVKVINLLDNIEDIVGEISACENTVSSSLHGLIVSHSYGVSSLWCNFSDKKLAGDDIKFKDYFSSVDISEYLPFTINLKELNVLGILDLIHFNESKTLIRANLEEIQKRLVESAPFEILPQYKSIYV